MKTRPPKELIWLSALALTAYAAAVLWLTLSYGVHHQTNIASLLGLPLMLGALLVTACGVASLFWSVLAFRASSQTWRVMGLAVGVLTVTVPWSLCQGVPSLAAVAERRDFEKAGPGALRAAAGALIRGAAQQPWERGYFGFRVPPAEVPPVIRTLVPEASYVAVDDQCVVIVTDGLGGWRGGYAIVPAGSSFVPRSSRRLAEGFYYVVDRPVTAQIR